MKLIAYYRVSTSKQGKSGLGLEAQRRDVEAYAAGSGATVIAEFTEIESGGKSDRAELQAAIERCQLVGGRLVIAKLDRLSRSVGFIAQLQDSGVRFVACDMPEANETMVQLMSVMAQAERKAISVRTRAALQAAKARGVQLGNPNLAAAREARTGDVTAKARKARKVKANRHADLVMREIQSAQGEGLSSLGQIAGWLNEQQIGTPRGCEWTRAAVARVLKRKRP
ncbi:recombinase family protein [Marinobacterium mangrovicola]|uniref:Recombinase n=1 Tax=Marinobacterium mangrovicola TaxID=1476959 RepID=A0A4R1GCT4_9GAMM|nr:recombinase family protein [Marinobacterium mangrovicola]TCK05864.1 recombinase [Marinobacterium mangrovicola]